MLSSRNIVKKTLEFDNPARIPRDFWCLPWADIHHPEKTQKIRNDYPSDFVTASGFVKNPPPVQGSPHKAGIHVDEWGCIFENVVDGVTGEVKSPIVKGEEWEDFDNVRIPTENLDVDFDQVNSFCKNTDKFVFAGCMPRPFERLQFIRSTELLYMDLMLRPDGLLEFIKRMHEYDLKTMELWASKSDVDTLMIMDDWGAQNSLLINPALWVELFKPLYKDYIDVAHHYGKKIFMHSDGHIMSILPHLVELGLDAINSQIFCMGIDAVSEFAGKITFWGEIDRQHILPYGTLEDVNNAVSEVYNKLWKNGGCIGMCEFSIGSNPDNVYQVYKAWDEIRG